MTASEGAARRPLGLGPDRDAVPLRAEGGAEPRRGAAWLLPGVLVVPVAGDGGGRNLGGRNLGGRRLLGGGADAEAGQDG